MPQTSLKTLLLGAGAGLASAHPAAFWPYGGHEHHHFPKPSYLSSAPSSSAASDGFPSFSIFPTGSGISAVTGYATASGTGFAGTGTAPVPTGYSSSSALVSFSPVVSSSAVASDVASSSTAAAAASTSELSESTATASSDCTFTSASDAISGKSDCKSIILSGIAVPKGTTLDMTDLADGTTVTFEGTTTFGYEEWDGPLISFSGTDITIQGASGHVIDMDGASWWDGKGSNGGKTKPKGFYAHDLKDSVIKNLKIENTPVQCFSIDGASNLQIIDVTVDDSAGDSDDLGHNTDAFDIGDSTGVYISGAVVKNQDDCVAINSGTDITFTGGTCSGGHGLSIGSVGGRSDNTVSGVVFSDSTVSDSENGVRIKTVSGATGSVSNVTYSGITLSGITDYGIVIEQDYENGDPTGTPTSGVPITDLTLSDIKGTVSGGQDYYILCASCSDWTVSDVDVTGGDESKSCKGVPSAASSLC